MAEKATSRAPVTVVRDAALDEEVVIRVLVNACSVEEHHLTTKREKVPFRL